MYFVALATDYDGTLAEDGKVAASTLAALRSLRESGRKIIMVTGRELPDLQRVFDSLACFDLVVAENGALLYDPSTAKETALAAEPPRVFAERLRERQVPISVGRGIVATWEPHETTVLDVVRELGLEMQIIFNKGAVMVLPAGINKASGLAAALAQLGLSPLNVVGVGDAENDHAFLQACGCGVAVANALPMVKASARIVTIGARGAGVVELIDLLIKDDLAAATKRMPRHLIELARESDGAAATISPRDSILIVGSPGGGQSTVTAGLLERAVEGGFQFCVIDPEGDYAGLDGAVTLGDAKTPPRRHELMELLEQPEQNLVVDLTGVEFADRPSFFASLLPQLGELRARTSRPHWLLIDNAHHVLPSVLGSAPVPLSREFAGAILVTSSPDQVAKPALEIGTKVMTVGQGAAKTMEAFFGKLENHASKLGARPIKAGQALLWDRESGGLRWLHTIRPHTQRPRRSHKFAEGELGDNECFYFRGPQQALNLKAQNLNIFLQMAEGVDDATWLFHLRAGDYSRWLKSIKDDDLAAAVSAIETDTTLDATESRAKVKSAIDSGYTVLE